MANEIIDVAAQGRMIAQLELQLARVKAGQILSLCLIATPRTGSDDDFFFECPSSPLLANAMIGSLTTISTRIALEHIDRMNRVAGSA